MQLVPFAGLLPYLSPSLRPPDRIPEFCPLCTPTGMILAGEETASCQEFNHVPPVRLFAFVWSVVPALPAVGTGPAGVGSARAECARRPACRPGDNRAGTPALPFACHREKGRGVVPPPLFARQGAGRGGVSRHAVCFER